MSLTETMPIGDFVFYVLVKCTFNLSYLIIIPLNSHESENFKQNSENTPTANAHMESSLVY